MKYKIIEHNPKTRMDSLEERLNKVSGNIISVTWNGEEYVIVFVGQSE